MFILSIIPLHLTQDMGTIPTNQFNKIDVAEHRVMEIEAVLTAGILRQYTTTSQEFNNANVDFLRAELEKAKQDEISTRSEMQQKSVNDPTLRLDYINKVKEVVDLRINDINLLSQAIIENKNLNYIVSGVDNSNYYSVNAELLRVMQYKQELDTSSNFWKAMADMQTQAQDLEEGSAPNLVNSKSITDPQLLNQIAISKVRVTGLKELLGSIISKKEPIEKLISQESSLRQEIDHEMHKAKTKDNVNPSIQKVSGLRSELSSTIQKKSIAEVLSNLEDNVEKEIYSEITFASQFV